MVEVNKKTGNSEFFSFSHFIFQSIENDCCFLVLGFFVVLGYFFSSLTSNGIAVRSSGGLSFISLSSCMSRLTPVFNTELLFLDITGKNQFMLLWVLFFSILSNELEQGLKNRKIIIIHW